MLRRPPTVLLTLLVSALAMAAVACDTGDGKTMQRPNFVLTLPWGNGGAIDVAATCDGSDVSPLLEWTLPPEGGVELALLVTDQDADGFVHWAVAGIPPESGEQLEGTAFADGVEGVNDFGDIGWGGPCPPVGETHTYRFALHALDEASDLERGFEASELLEVVDAASIGVSEVTGVYTRADPATSTTTTTSIPGAPALPGATSTTSTTTAGLATSTTAGQ